MKNFCVYIIALIIIGNLIGCNNLNENLEIIALQGATIFDGKGVSITKGVILIKDGRIVALGEEDFTIPKEAEIINVDGKFITPGLIDTHVHLVSTGFFDSRANRLDLRDSIPHLEVQAYQKKNPERYFNAYLSSGVTAIYDVGGFPWSIELQYSSEENHESPHIAAAGPMLTTGPAGINTPTEKAMVPLESEEVGRKLVEHNTRSGSTGIKVLGMVIKDSSFMRNLRAVADEVEKRENKLIVHAQSLEEAKAALRFNCKLLVHSVSDLEVDDEFIELMKANEAIYTPTLIVREGYYHAYRTILGHSMMYQDPNNLVDEKTKSLIKGAENFKKFIDITYVEDQIKLLENTVPKRDSINAINLRKLFAAGIMITVGSDAGNPGTLHGISFFDELEAMQAAGIPANELIVMATRNGAVAMERDTDIGTLEPNKIADLIILEKDPSKDISNLRSITHVMRKGILKSIKGEK